MKYRAGQPQPQLPPRRPTPRPSLGRSERSREPPGLGGTSSVVVMLLVSYVPFLLTKPGRVAADTKQYLYLDPGRLTTGAASLWDPNVGLGTVTHQNIGYLWPMGPYYTAVQWLGVPVWIAQRMWMGSLVFAAGLGVIYFARLLGVTRLGSTVAGLAYMLSPYMVDYLARTSAIAMPWAGLGWMAGLTVVAARTGSWRPVAAFALVVGLVGGVNATSILLVGLAPLAWLAYAALVSGEITRLRAVRTALRIGVTTIAVSLWWIAGLWAEGRYGLDVLRVTETVPTVAHTSSAAEVLRGLGYWYFYGWDKVQPWTQASVPYTQSLWLLAVGFAVPAASVALGWFGRWRYRPFAIVLVVVGTVVAVGAYPYDRPSPLGRLIESAATGSSLALAMRSVDRIVPLVVLGLALLMGSGVAGLRLARPGAGAVAAVACVGLVVADVPPLWTGQIVASNLSRPSHIPGYWYQAASYLNAGGDATRVLGLPGEDFGAYSWGVTQDPIPPGLLDRPYVSRQIVPAGTPGAANLLQALDEPLQEGSLDLDALAPVARLMSVGAILLQSDLQYERYDLPLPQVLWRDLQPTPAGLGAPRAFGAPDPAPQIRYPLDSEARLGLPPAAPQPPALAVFPVAGSRPISRTEPVTNPLLIAGDGRGVVEAALAGLLSGDPTVLYSGTFARDPAGFARAMSDGARLVLTDTNLRAGERWGTLSDNMGEVETLARPLVSDPSTYSLPVFPGAGSDSQTIGRLRGVTAVRATAYGNPVTYTPESRPFNAVDGDPSTAWSFGAHSPVGGERIRIDLSAPVRIGHIRLLQTKGLRHLTAVTIELDGRPGERVALNGTSRRGAGQVINFPVQEVNRIDVVADKATGGAHNRYDGLGSVGLREIGIPSVAPARESLRLPTDLLSRAGGASLSHPLTVLLSRLRAPQPPRTDPERRMVRSFSLPTARTFAVGGSAEIATTAPDSSIDRLVGAQVVPGPAPGTADVLSADSSGRLIGDRDARATAAIDGDPKTAWIPETGRQVGTFLSYVLSRPLTLDHLDLQLIDDGRHSIPTRLSIDVDGVRRTVGVPPVRVGVGRPQGATTPVRVDFPSVTGSKVKITVDAVKETRAANYYATFTGATDLLPVGIAELGLPVRARAVPARVPVACRSDLLRVDGKPVPVAVAGSTADALGGRQLALTGCGVASSGLRLSAGTHTVETAPAAPSGLSVDTLSLESAAGGAAAPRMDSDATTATGGSSPGSLSPAVRVTHQDRTSETVTVNGDGRPFWLVLGQSQSAGWTATIAGGHSLGTPVLVDGYANGWYVPAGAVRGATVIRLEWTPQRVVWTAIAVSAVSLAVLTAVAFLPASALGGNPRWGSRRRRLRRWRRDGGRRGAGRQRRLWRRRLPSSVPPRTGLNSPIAPMGPSSLSGWAAIAVTAGVGALVAAASSPTTVGVAFLGATVAARWRLGRGIVRAAAVVTLVVLGASVVVQQARWHYWPTIDWPVDFRSANDMAWLAVALLGADACATIRRLPKSRTSTAQLIPGGVEG